jgi:hypothetical protein
MGESALLTRPKAHVHNQDLHKFYGKCLTDTGEEVILIVKASSEAEAGDKLHGGYLIQMVLELRTEAEHSHARLGMRPSLTSSNNYY